MGETHPDQPGPDHAGPAQPEAAGAELSPRTPPPVPIGPAAGCGSRVDVTADGMLIRRWEDAPLAQEVFTLNNMMIRIADRMVGHLGLTGSRWMLISALKDRCDNPPTISELSKDALLTVQNVSRMVASMEADGLVERFNIPGKGRSVFIRLTDKGRSVDEAAAPYAKLFTSWFLSGLSEAQRREAQHAMDKLIFNLDRLARALDERPHDELLSAVASDDEAEPTRVESER